MRTIKFRAWDKNLKNWITGSKKGFNLFGECTLIGGVLTQKHYTENCFERLYSDVIVEQYTGLKDKNGVEIYEGDIIRVPETSLPEGEGGYVQKEGNQVIEWTCDDDGTYCENHHIGFSIMKGDIVIPYDIEVIGNVHENPELLTDVEPPKDN